MLEDLRNKICFVAVGLNLVLALVLTPAAHGETECAWLNTRDHVDFGTISSIKEFELMSDCVNAIGITVLLTEPLRGTHTYNGRFVLKNGEGRELASCTSATVRPMTEPEQTQTLNWLFNHRAQMTDARYLNLLRSEPWQSLLRSHLTVRCDAPDPVS